MNKYVYFILAFLLITSCVSTQEEDKNQFDPFEIIDPEAFVIYGEDFSLNIPLKKWFSSTTT